MNELTITQKVNETLKILYNHMKLDNGQGVTINKNDLIFITDTIKDLIDSIDTLDLCDFCARPCLEQPYGKQICIENYYDQWML